MTRCLPIHPIARMMRKLLKRRSAKRRRRKRKLKVTLEIRRTQFLRPSASSGNLSRPRAHRPAPVMARHPWNRLGGGKSEDAATCTSTGIKTHVEGDW